MENLKAKPRFSETKPVATAASKRSPVVQRKLDEANEDLAKLSEESLEKLLSMTKKKE